MKNRILWCILFLGAMFFVVSCSSSWIQDSIPHISNTHMIIDWKEGKLDFINTISSTYINDETFLTCLKENLDICIQESSYSMNNTLNCEDLLLEKNRITCKETQVIIVAREQWDITLCDDLWNTKSRCISEVIILKAVREWNIDLCNTLEDWDIISCKNQVFFSQALETNDIRLCDSIITYSEEDINYQKDMCIYEVNSWIETNRSTIEE